MRSNAISENIYLRNMYYLGVCQLWTNAAWKILICSAQIAIVRFAFCMTLLDWQVCSLYFYPPFFEYISLYNLLSPKREHMHDFIVLHLPPYLKTEDIFYLLVAKKPFKKYLFVFVQYYFWGICLIFPVRRGGASDLICWIPVS